jgi:hypothetical protein
LATDAAWPTTTKAADREAHVMTIEEYMRLAHAALDEAYTDALRRGCNAERTWRTNRRRVASLYNLVPADVGG